MTNRHVLFLDAAHLTAYQVKGGVLLTGGTFAADAKGIEAFGEYVAQHRDNVFMLLADIAEEGFHLENIPRSSGRDRTALIKRKLAQYFYGTPLALAISQGRLQEGRRDERLLLMALTRPQHFEPWLATLDAAKVAVAGVYSLPQILTTLLPKDLPPRLLIVTLTRGGLRQTFFADGQLRFSRLTALATGTPEESASATVLEAAKMRQYLVGQRLIERGQPLATRVLVHPAQIAMMREHCRDAAELQFDFVDLLAEAKRAGLRTPLTDSHAEMLFCHLLIGKTPAGQFVPAAERQFYRLWQIRRVLKSASSLILVGALLFAAKQGLEILQVNEDIGQIELQTRIDQQRYDTTLLTLPKIPLSTENLLALVNRYEAVLLRSPGPGPLLVQLSQSLDSFPDISIERIEWSIVEQLPLVLQGSAHDIPPPPAMASGPYAEAKVEARLPPAMAGNQRGQLGRVADFAKHLGAAPNTLVTVVQQPVDAQSGQTLKSGDEKRALEAPRFSFRLTRKL
ncbi:MAG: hypothetical protein KKF85_00960 [Gammaproteobacteria bacterium]|nr:hypothetical protein [Rhodocyclaceae bacterium]MBU3908215.1 hypothetical protein [Gammaproteobacteria bacterium]MBU3990696.1 hypothetical protein [Gammaproteobacteria bacterium]MBU4003148.1 hypothetical protein [Gammaproteobacteria bacterium]MBU4019990.1 hypothetical protein [Gammaproteobacteria bacterium]